MDPARSALGNCLEQDCQLRLLKMLLRRKHAVLQRWYADNGTTIFAFGSGFRHVVLCLGIEMLFGD
jgi:hypothetical protein